MLVLVMEVDEEEEEEDDDVERIIVLMLVKGAYTGGHSSSFMQNALHNALKSLDCNAL